jgi:hypothetical protein
MQTDIRKMVEGLRPTADFRSKVEATISALNVRIEDIIVADEEDRQEVEELTELSDFWSTVLTNMDKE